VADVAVFVAYFTEDSCFNGPIPRSRLVWVSALFAHDLVHPVFGDWLSPLAPGGALRGQKIAGLGAYREKNEEIVREHREKRSPKDRTTSLGGNRPALRPEVERKRWIVCAIGPALRANPVVDESESRAEPDEAGVFGQRPVRGDEDHGRRPDARQDSRRRLEQVRE